MRPVFHSAFFAPPDSVRLVKQKHFSPCLGPRRAALLCVSPVPRRQSFLQNTDILVIAVSISTRIVLWTKVFFLHFLILCVCHVHKHTHTTVLVQRSEDNLHKSSCTMPVLGIEQASQAWQQTSTHRAISLAPTRQGHATRHFGFCSTWLLSDLQCLSILVTSQPVAKTTNGQEPIGLD